MRVGSKGRYAVVAMIDVAQHSDARPVALAEVAQRKQISLSYLEQLFAMLRRAGLVTASRGPGGGYRLQRSTRDISLAEIFGAVAENASSVEGGRDWSSGPAADVWDRLDGHIVQFLQGVSLEQAAASNSNQWTGRPQAADNLSAERKLA